MPFPRVSSTGGASAGGTPSDGSVTDAKVAANAAIAASKIAGTAVTAADAGTVTSTMLAGSIAPSKVTGTAVTAADTGTVTSAMLAGSIAPSKVTGTALVASNNLSDVTAATALSNIGAASLAGTVGGPASIIRRTSDSAARNSGNSGITLTNDDTLLLAVGINQVWFIEGFLFYTSANTAMDFKCTFTVPTGGTMLWGALGGQVNGVPGYGATATANSPIAILAAGGALSVGSNSNQTGLSVGGVFAADGSHTGSVTFQWAQNTSDAGNLVLNANSFLRCSRLA